MGGIFIYFFFLKKKECWKKKKRVEVAYNIIPARHPHTPVAGDGNCGSVGEDELDFIETLAPAPVLDGSSPTCARVAETVDEDYRRRVSGRGRKKKGGGSDNGRHV